MDKNINDMEATGLRIGNWVHHINEWSYRQDCRSTEIYEFDFQFNDNDWYAIGECTMKLEYIEPILLTKEWLLKFGFEFYEGEIIGETSMNDNWTLGLFKINVWGNGWLFYWDDKWDNKLQYVHQLQNLYFVLTGEELKA